MINNGVQLNSNRGLKVNTKFSKSVYSWLKSAKIRCKKTTYSNYQYIVDAHILPEFKDIKIKDLNNDLVNSFTEKLLANKLEAKTVKDILVIVKQICKYAGIDIVISMPKVKKNSIQILEKKEQQILEKFLQENISFKNLGIYLCLYTGLRIGEICALKWENIDLENGNIYIKETITRIKNSDSKSKQKTIILIDSPKSMSSFRVIPLPAFLTHLFKTTIKNVNESDYFLTGTKNYIEPRNYFNYYKRIMKKLGIKDYNFHALRHTFATRCVESGFDPKLLSEILGHSSVKITLERYVHPSYDNKVFMMNKLKPMN